jgi:hypothetical protein
MLQDKIIYFRLWHVLASALHYITYNGAEKQNNPGHRP